MRTTMMWLWLVVALAACEMTGGGDGAAVQAVAGPSVTVTPRGAGELAVSWSTDAAAVRYSVFEGGALAASVFDSGGGAPSTSWIATGLDAGQHCYTVQSVYADGSKSALSVPSCSTPSGPTPSGGDTTDTILGADFKATTGTVAYVNGRILTTSAATIVARLPLHPGDRLKSISSLIGGNGSVDVPSYSVLIISSGVPSTLADASFVDLLSTDAEIDVPDTTLAVGQAVIVKVVSNAGLLALDDVRYTYDHPAQ